MSSVKDITFKVKVIGETTKEEFCGVFKTRPTINFGLQMERDRLRREFLGSVGTAGERIAGMAGIFADLAVRLTESPPWWKESNGGLNLEDDNVLKAVYDAQGEVQKAFYEDLKTKESVAKTDLENLAQE